MRRLAESVAGHAGFRSIDALGESGRAAYKEMMDQVDALAKASGAVPRWNPLSIDPIVLSDTPQQRTARQTESMAEALDTMRGHMAALVDATTANLQLSREARDDNREAQRSTHRMSVASLWVSIGSGVAALGSLIVSVIALLVAH